MNLPEGTHLAYVVNHEAWYASSVLPNEPPTIMVDAAADGGGVAWEFAIEDGSQRIGRPGLHLKMWDDSWAALTQMPEFFAALADGDMTTLDQVRELLDSLGAVDVTARVSPYGPEKPAEPELVRCPGVGCQGRAWRMPGGPVFCEESGGIVPENGSAQ